MNLGPAPVGLLSRAGAGEDVVEHKGARERLVELLQELPVAAHDLGNVVGGELVFAEDLRGVEDLPPGSEVRIKESREKWSFVEIPGEPLRVGWIRTPAATALWPYPPTLVQ